MNDPRQNLINALATFTGRLVTRIDDEQVLFDDGVKSIEHVIAMYRRDTRTKIILDPDGDTSDDDL